MKLKFVTRIICLTLLCTSTYAQTSNSDFPTTVKKTVKMKEFMLLVRVPTTYSTEQAKAVNPKWDKVLDKWKTDNVFVTSFVFPGESYVLSGADRVIKNEAVVSDNVKVVSNIILRAASLDDALELAKACPVLEHGGTIEVREIIPRVPKPTN